MNGHTAVADILRSEFSDMRKKSCDVLGVGISSSEGEIRR